MRPCAIAHSEWEAEFDESLDVVSAGSDTDDSDDTDAGDSRTHRSDRSAAAAAAAEAGDVDGGGRRANTKRTAVGSRPDHAKGTGPARSFLHLVDSVFLPSDVTRDSALPQAAEKLPGAGTTISVAGTLRHVVERVHDAMICYAF